MKGVPLAHAVQVFWAMIPEMLLRYESLYHYYRVESWKWLISSGNGCVSPTLLTIVVENSVTFKNQEHKSILD